MGDVCEDTSWVEALLDGEGTSSSVLGPGHCGDLPTGIWGCRVLDIVSGMARLDAGDIWGQEGVGLSCLLCASVAKQCCLTQISLSLCLAPPFFYLCPAPITPLHLSELEGEAGADSEEGKKGFSFPGSLPCGCPSLRAPRMPWPGPGVLNAWVPPNHGVALGWHMASEQSALHYPSAACSYWVVLLSSLMKLWALGARIGNCLFQILLREGMSLLGMFAALPAALSAFLLGSSSKCK